jgi:excisionase family DNA binding protein
VGVRAEKSQSNDAQQLGLLDSLRVDATTRLPSSGSSRRKPGDRERGLPRLAVKPDEAAEMLGVSRDYFDEHIKPELRIVRRGSKTILIAVAELQRWLDKSATRFSR